MLTTTEEEEEAMMAGAQTATITTQNANTLRRDLGMRKKTPAIAARIVTTPELAILFAPEVATLTLFSV
jgi:hypothetical protein